MAPSIGVGSVTVKGIAMLDSVECKRSGTLPASGSEAEWPHPKWVRVDSKSQAPYKFHPCLNPCAPGEWPYDLQALLGTEDWDDVIAWYLKRHPAVSGEDVLRFAQEVIRCAQGRALSVGVRNDPELAQLSLWFTLWDYKDGEYGLESAEVRLIDRIWFSVPAYKRLFGDVGVDVRHCAFGDRLHPREG
ncbi:hypothetical protein [Mitsuaria sp. GD03876]|uniref:hypothetical protein n=1 Tax=Mitsuaria sp. GD03876 TaxID=2975399 RepID=UPI0024481C0A|nr:hypothetical protein [Mitsuaria sp. GD03876]MDH0864730.1 hypothetical protein [Mitsuaria sp. GD03876]